MKSLATRERARTVFALLAVMAAAAAFSARLPAAPGAEGPGALPPERKARLDEAGQKAAAALAAPEPVAPESRPQDLSGAMAEIPKMNLLELAIAGGPLMVPIALFSVIVVALALERWIALRRGAVVPRKLVREFKALTGSERGIDPRQAYRLCQKYPSCAATVIRALLLKAGRPSGEVAQAAQEASQREAERLHGNVRWLNLSAAVAPMLGLLGTVQGMIFAFYIVSHLPAGVNKAQVLAESIYIALVTTFGGLTVAIPAAIFAHLFGGRILKLFREIDELVQLVQVQVERFERRQRAAAAEGPVKGDGPRVAPADEGRIKPPTPTRT